MLIGSRQFCETIARAGRLSVPGRLVMTRVSSLREVLEVLRAHEPELRRLGVRHASVFGSVARGEARPDSDIDVLVDLDPARPIGVFECARLKLHIGELVGGAGDVVNRKTLKLLLRESVLRDVVGAF